MNENEIGRQAHSFVSGSGGFFYLNVNRAATLPNIADTTKIEYFGYGKRFISAKRC
jgi:hypothetical protein